MTLERYLQALRAINLLICVAGVHPAARLIRISTAMEHRGRPRTARAFLVLAYGLVFMTFGNAVLLGALLYTRAAMSLWPGVLMVVQNSLLVAGMFLLGSTSDER